LGRDEPHFSNPPGSALQGIGRIELGASGADTLVAWLTTPKLASRPERSATGWSFASSDALTACGMLGSGAGRAFQPALPEGMMLVGAEAATREQAVAELAALLDAEDEEAGT
jgi:hypothetical protein